jgi:hypothetical protein
MHYLPRSNASLELDKISLTPAQTDSFAPETETLLTDNMAQKLGNHPGLSIAISRGNAAVLEIRILDFTESIATSRDHGTF